MKTEIKGLLACAGLASTKDTIPNKSMCTFSRIMTRFSLFLFTGTFYLPVVQSQPVSSGSQHRVIQLQERYNTVDAVLRKRATETLDEGFTDREYTQWLTSARQGEDAELRELVLSHERAYRDMLQVVNSMARSVAFAAEREDDQAPVQAAGQDGGAGTGRVYSEAEQEELMRMVQKLTELRMERNALLADEQEVSADLAGNIQELEQQIFDVINRDDTPELLIPDADGDTL